MNLKALQAGVDPKQLGAALENTRPFKMDPGAMYQYANGSREQIPQAQPGMTMVACRTGRSYSAQPIANYNAIIGDQELNKGMGQNNARLWLEAQQRANTVVPQQMQSGKTEPVTAQAQLDYAKAQQSIGIQIPAQEQARRDAIAKGIYNAEGAGQFSPRLNDRKGVPGVRPQVANLDSPGGQSPAEAAQALLGPEAQKAVNTNWIEKRISLSLMPDHLRNQTLTKLRHSETSISTRAQEQRQKQRLHSSARLSAFRTQRSM